MKYTFLLLILLSIISCHHESKPNPKDLPFHVPVVVQGTYPDTFSYFKASHIQEIRPILIGKLSFCDTISLYPREEIFETPIEDRLQKKSDLESPEIRYDGFELYPDYQTTIAKVDEYPGYGKYYYPLYIVNNTTNDKVFTAKGVNVYAIQEAQDSNEVWLPIEIRTIDFCGFGSWEFKTHPKEFVGVLMPKYQGDYQTNLRVRILIGDIIYISPPFKGKINYEQFYLDKEDDTVYQRLTDYPFMTPLNLFCGSLPLEFRY